MGDVWMGKRKVGGMRRSVFAGEFAGGAAELSTAAEAFEEILPSDGGGIAGGEEWSGDGGSICRCGAGWSSGGIGTIRQVFFVEVAGFTVVAFQFANFDEAFDANVGDFFIGDEEAAAFVGGAGLASPQDQIVRFKAGDCIDGYGKLVAQDQVDTTVEVFG